MPPRWFCCTILVSWLAFNGWLVWRELLPRLLPDQPPVYAVELIEEAQTNRAAVPWVVYLDGGEKEVARIRTHVEHPHRDIFDLKCEMKPALTGNPITTTTQLPLGKLASGYQVNAAGELLGVTAHVDAHVEQLRTAGSYDIEGDVQQGRMTPRFRVSLAGPLLAGKNPTVDLDTLHELDRNGLLLPLHPLNHIHGLRFGQTWNAHLLDPLAVVRLGPAGLIDTLTPAHATVRPQETLFTWGKRQDVPCWVIDYEGVDRTVSIWVSRKDDKVLRQDAQLGKSRWTIYRD